MASPFAYLYAAGTDARTPNTQRKLSPVGEALLKQTGPSSDPRVQKAEQDDQEVLTPKRQTHFKLPDGTLKPLTAPSGERYLLKNSGWRHPRDPKTNEPVLVNEQGEARSIYDDAPRIKKDGKIYAAPAGYEKKELGPDPDFNPNAMTKEQEKANLAKQKEDEKTAKEQDAYAKAVLERDVSQIITDSEVKSLETAAAEKKAKLAEAEISDKRMFAKEALTKAERDAEDRKIGSAEELAIAQEQYNAARKSEEQAKAATRAIEARQIEEDLANAKQKETLNQFESALKLENTGRRQSLSMPTPTKAKEPTASETAPVTTPISALPTGKGLDKAIAASKAPDIRIEPPIAPTFLTGAPRTDIPPVPEIAGGPLPWQKQASRTLIIEADPNFGDEPIEPGTDLTQEVEFDAAGKGSFTGSKPRKAAGKKMGEGMTDDVPPEWTSSNALTAQATARDTGTDVIHTDSTLSVELPASRLDAEGALKVDGKQVGIVRRTMLGLPEIELAPATYGQTASPSYRSSDPFKGAPEYAAPSATFREQQAKAGNPFAAEKPWREQRWGDKQVAEFIENWKGFGDAERRKLMDSDLLKEMEGEMPDARFLFTNGYVSLQQARQIDQAVYGRSQKLPDFTTSFDAWKGGESPAAAKLREMEAGGITDASNRELVLARQRVLTEWEGEYRKRHGTQPDFDPNALVSASKTIGGTMSTGWQTFVSDAEDLGSSVGGSVSGLAQWFGKQGIKMATGTLGRSLATMSAPTIPQEQQQAIRDKQAQGSPLSNEEKALLFRMNYTDGKNVSDEALAMIEFPKEAELAFKKLQSDIKALGSKWKENDEDPRNVMVIAPGLAVEAGIKSFDTQAQKDAAVKAYLDKRNKGEGNVLADIDLLKEHINNDTLTPDVLKTLSDRIKAKGMKNVGMIDKSNDDQITQKGQMEADKANRYDLMQHSNAAALLAGYKETRDESYIDMLKDLMYSTAEREELIMEAGRHASMEGLIQHSDSWGAWNLTRRGIQTDLKELGIEALGTGTGFIISKALNPSTRIFKAAGKAGTAATRVQQTLAAVDRGLFMLQKSKTLAAMKEMGEAYSKAGLRANSPILNAIVQKGKEIPLQMVDEGIQGFSAGLFEEGKSGKDLMHQAVLEGMGGFIATAAYIPPVMGLGAVERMKANTASQKHAKAWADSWNARHPEQPITAADAMGVHAVIDQRDLAQARKTALEAIATLDVYLDENQGPPPAELSQPVVNAMWDIHGIEQVGIQTYQELEGIGDKRMKAFVKAGLRTLTGQPLTTADQQALGAVNAAGEPLIIMHKGQVVFTDAGLAEVSQAAPGISGRYFPSKQEQQELAINAEAELAATPPPLPVEPAPAEAEQSPAASPAEPTLATSDQLTSGDVGTSVVDEIDTELDRKHAEWQAGKKEVDDAFNATEPHSKERKEAREKRKQWEEKNGQVPPPSSSNPLSDVGTLSNKDSDTKFSLAGTGWRLTGEKEKSIRGKTILRVTNGKEWRWVEEGDLTDQHRQILARSSSTSVDKAAHDAASSPTNNKRPPTPDEIAAGNYAKGHPTIGGIKISIENPAGSKRSGKDDGGKSWEVQMKAHYGYMRGTVGADGDQIDVFVKEGTPENFDGMAFVIPQRKPDGSFDEHKVMIGYASIEEAKAAYKAHYAKGWQGYRPAMPVPMSELASMVKSGKLKKPNQRQRTNDTTPGKTTASPTPTPTPTDSGRVGEDQRASGATDGGEVQPTPQGGGIGDGVGQDGAPDASSPGDSSVGNAPGEGVGTTDSRGEWSIRTNKGRKLTIPASAATDSEQAKKALAAQLGGKRGEMLVLDSLTAPDVEQTLAQSIYEEVAKIAARAPARDKQLVMHLGRLILAAVRKHEKMLGIAFADIKIVSGKVEGGGMYVQGKTLHISPATLIRSMTLFKPAYIETFVDTGFFHEALHPIIEMNVTPQEAAMFWDELKPEAQEAFLTSYEQDNPGSLAASSTQKGYEYLRALIERKYNAHTSEELFIHAGVSAKIIAAIKKVVEFLRDLQSALKEGGDFNLVKDIADKAEMAFLDSGITTGNVDAQRNATAGKAKAEPIGNSARARAMVNEEFGAMAKAMGIDIIPNYAGPSAHYVISEDGKRRGGYIEINPVKVANWSRGQMMEAMREEMIHAIEDRALVAEMQKAGYKLSDPYIQSGDYHVDFFKGVYDMMSPEQIAYVKDIYSSHGNREYVIGSEFRRMLLQKEHYNGLTESAMAGGKNSAKAKKAIAAIAALLKTAVKYLRALATTNTEAGKQAARIYEESRKMLQKLDPRGDAKPLAMARPSPEGGVMDIINADIERDHWKATDLDSGEEIVYPKTQTPPPLKEGKRYKFTSVVGDQLAMQAMAAPQQPNGKAAGWNNGIPIKPQVSNQMPVKDVRKMPEAPKQRMAGPNSDPLVGLPSKVTIPGIGERTFGPYQPARDTAVAYMKQAGMSYDPPRTYAKVNKDRAARIAAEFDAMKHEPQDPKVKAAYAALIKETVAQWEAIKKTGLKVSPMKQGMTDPYAASPRLAQIDVEENNHLWFFPTDFGFGNDVTGFDPKDNPLFEFTGEVIDGHKMRANDVFRIVHDYFGHFKEGVGFRADGEENAWRQHAAMFSPESRGALTSETRGQNSWLNFGPHGEKNRTAKVEDTVFADQKIGLMPEWTWLEGAGDTQAMAAPSRGYLGTITEDNEVIGVKVNDLSKAYHSDYREITNASEGFQGDFRYNADDKIVYWWNPGSLNPGHKQKVADWLEANGQEVKSHKNVKGSQEAFARAHGVQAMAAPMPNQKVTAYHGSPYQFDKPRRSSTGFWLTTEKSVAERGYARGGEVKQYTVDTTGFADLTRDKELAKKLIKAYNTEPDVIEEDRKIGVDPEYAATIFSGAEPESILRDMGYSGAIVWEEPGVASINAFDPDKSVQAMAAPQSELNLGKKADADFLRQKNVKRIIDQTARRHPEAKLVSYIKDGDKFRLDDKGLPAAHPEEYNFAESTLAKSAMKGLRGDARLKAFERALADKLKGFYDQIKGQPEVMAGKEWYRVAREKLVNVFGDDTMLFAQLLAATSARTPVQQNFEQALDAYNGIYEGRFNGMTERYLDAMKSLEAGELRFRKSIGNNKMGDVVTPKSFREWLDIEGIMPRRENGKKFNANSMQVLNVIAGVWREKLGGPKTAQFSDNLSGASLEATVDVWAARTLHRMSNEQEGARWRILPEAETGVNNEDFAIGQAAFKIAASELGMNPDDLQGVLWFAEKRHWANNGWTRAAGAELSDFSSLLDFVTTEGGKKVLRIDNGQGMLAFDDTDTTRTTGPETRRIRSRATGATQSVQGGAGSSAQTAAGRGPERVAAEEQRSLFMSAPKIENLTKTSIQGMDAETGKPITFKFLHNKSSYTKERGRPYKPSKDEMFDRGYEPSGQYMVATEDDYLIRSYPNDYITGTTTFNNPIVIKAGEYGEESSWKRSLSKAYGGKSGKALSKAIIASGHDGIITVPFAGNHGEIVDLTTFDESKALFMASPQQDAAYAAAIKSGDTQAARKMLDEAAAQAGYTVKAFHGTNKSFRKFKAQFGRALWFSEDRKKIEDGESGAQGTKKIMEVYLRPGRVAGRKEYNNLIEGQLLRDFDSTKLDEDWIVYSPNDVKSAELVTKSGGEMIPLSERFNDATGDIRFMAGPNSDPQRANFVEPGFYSELQRTIANKMPNSMRVIPATTIKGKATTERTITNPKTGQVIKVIKANNEPDKTYPAKSIGEQVRAMLLNADVTEDEIKWSGIVPWLDGRESVTKDEVIDYLRTEGQVRFAESVLSDDKGFKTQINEDETAYAGHDVVDVIDPRNGFVRFSGTPSEARNWIDEENGATGRTPKYATYQLPGGTNYREVVLAMPTKETVYRVYQNGKILIALNKKSDADEFIAKRASWDNEPVEIKEETIDSWKGDYTSSHFTDVPNYVAHMRTNERTDAAGKSGMFIEELQSDRHQAGRKKGYLEDKTFTDLTPEEQARMEYLNNEAPTPLRNHQLAELERLRSRARQARNPSLREGIPDAPFRQSSAWGLHLFKRALRDAVESGKEWIGWTVGDTQNDRFSLEKQIDTLGYHKWTHPEKGVVYNLMAGKNNKEVFKKQSLTESELEDHVGTEMKDKIVAGEKTTTQKQSQIAADPIEWSVISGLDLKTGGSGMRGFYDRIMPREIGDYVKQWGGKVEKSNLIEGNKFDFEMTPFGVGDTFVLKDKITGKFLADRAQETFASRQADGEIMSRSVAKSVIEAYAKQVTTSMWRINITPQMRQSIANEGQALFMAGPRSESPQAAGEALEAWLALPATAAELQMLREQALSEETGKRTVGDPARAGLLGSGDKENRERDAIIQFRKNHKAPEKVVDWMRDGQELADSDPEMVADALIDNFYNGVGYDTPEQVFASAIVVSRMFKEARQKGDPALLRKAQALAYADGAARTENARILRSMVDPHRSPEERMHEFFSKLISTPSEFQRIEIEKAPSPLAKEREIAELKAQIEKLKEQVGTQTQGPVVEQKKKLEKTLDQAQQRKDRKTLVDEYTEARRKAVAAALKKEGLSEEDIFVSGEERLAAHNSDPVQEAIAQHPKEHREAINYIMRGYSHKDIAQMTKLPVNVVATIHQEFRQKSMRSSLAKWVKKGNTLFDTIQNGLKKVFGMSMAAPVPLAQARAQIIAEAEIERQLNVLVPTAQQVNSGKMVAVIVNKKSGQEVTIKVPFSASDFRASYRVGRAISTSESNAFDKIYEYWISFGLLSGPETHWANVAGNAGMLMLHLFAQKPMEAALNFAFRDPNSTTFREFGEMIKGVIPGVRDAFALAALAWDAEADPIGARYMDETIDLSFDSTGNLSKVGTMKGPAIQGTKGRVFRVSTRFLLAMDAFFKAITANIEVGARAYRLGKMSQAKGTLGTAKGDLEAFIAQQVATPGSESWELAIQTSKELAFQGDNWLTMIAGSLTARNQEMAVANLSKDVVKASAKGNSSEVFNAKLSRSAMMFTGFVMKFIFPFVKTPTNIIRIGARKAGLGTIGLLALAPYVMAKGVHNIAKGRNFHDGNQSALMITWLAEQIQAAAMWMYVWSIAEGDDDDNEKPFYIVGSRPYGTSKPGEREAAYTKSGGTQVVMVRNSDGTYTPWAYGRYEPFATVLTSVVDTIREIKNAKRLNELGVPGGSIENVMTNSIASFASQLQDKSFFQGFANVTKAIEKVMNKKSGELATDTVKGFLQGFVPNIVRQPIRNDDPKVRDSKKADALYLALPMGRFAEPLIDYYGRESEKLGTSVSRLLIRSANKPQDSTKAEEMIDRWNLLHPDKKFQPSRISKSDMWIYGPNKERRIITDNKLKTEFERELGHEILRRHNELAASIEGFPDDFDDRLRSEATKAREQVRKDFLNKSFERQQKLLK